MVLLYCHFFTLCQWSNLLLCRAKYCGWRGPLRTYLLKCLSTGACRWPFLVSAFYNSEIYTDELVNFCLLRSFEHFFILWKRSVPWFSSCHHIPFRVVHNLTLFGAFCEFNALLRIVCCSRYRQFYNCCNLAAFIVLYLYGSVVIRLLSYEIILIIASGKYPGMLPRRKDNFYYTLYLASYLL